MFADVISHTGEELELIAISIKELEEQYSSHARAAEEAQVKIQTARDQCERLKRALEVLQSEETVLRNAVRNTEAVPRSREF